MPGDRSRRTPLDLHGLFGVDEVFRLGGGTRHSESVERWFAEGPVELRALAQSWFERMKACGDDVVELMHDGCPVACVADVPFGYVNTFRSHVNIGFFHGARLHDPAGLLVGTGKRMRHVKLRPGAAVRTEALAFLIDAAYREAGLTVSRTRA